MFDWLDGVVTLALTVLFYTVTNTAPSTQPIISEHWKVVQHTARGTRKVFVAEMMGIGLRCAAIWVVAWLIKGHPDVNWLVAVLLAVFALMHTFGRTIKHIQASDDVRPRKAFAVIVTAEFALNIDNVAASAVDVNMVALDWALVLFMVLIFIVKGTELGNRLLKAYDSALTQIDHPRHWWRRTRWVGRTLMVVLGGVLLLALLPLMPLAWRSLLGLWRLHGRPDELGAGVWVFILVMLGTVAVFDAPAMIVLCKPYDLQLQQWLADSTGLTLTPTTSHDTLKWCVGVLAALLSTFAYLPVIEARARRQLAADKALSAGACP
jgi:hypothetical protein